MSRALSASSLPASVRAKLPKIRISKEARAALAALRKAKEDARIEEFHRLLEYADLPMPCLEYRFDSKRMWRFDFAWPTQHVALEVEGGIWTQGRHTRGAGALGDMDKYNAATVQGWKLLRTTPDRLTGNAIEHALRQLLR